MTEYIRTQVLLEKEQRSKLFEIAEQAGISFSELVRECLDAQLKARLYQEMRRAAEQLYTDYSGDGDLTDMTSLDSEEFMNE